MKERPILFSAPMVRAVLSGEKTQTRRIVKGDFHPLMTRENRPCPYGAPGDRLWVRETWAAAGNDDGRPVNSAGEMVPWGPDVACYYRADAEPGPYGADVLPDGGHFFGPWRPSIHMPRWASRLTLDVVGVRVERLQDLTRADARAEGVTTLPAYDDYLDQAQAIGVGTGDAELKVFAGLWDTINGERTSWDSNPWVWVVEFRRVP